MVTNRCKRRRIALERAQRLPHLKVNAFEPLLEHSLEFPRGIPTHHSCENGLWALLDPQGTITVFHRVERLTFCSAKRILHKILNRRQHARDHLPILPWH